MNVKVVLVDFYDSFTFNLAHYLEQLNVDVTVIRHDELKLNELDQVDAIVLSPGPGLPTEKENLLSLLTMFDSKKPILGVCLGMQAIGIHLGGSIENQQEVKHGVPANLKVKKNVQLFQDVPTSFQVGLYHSWKVVGIPPEWQTAQLENGVLMSIEVPERKLFGVQFHPESILTENGLKILANFLKFVQS